MYFCCYIFVICCFVWAQAYYVVQPIPEQSSRDLDLSFSTGNPAKSEPTRFNNQYYPARKVYTYRDYENANAELGIDRPNSFYEVSEMPARRAGWVETFIVPERKRKLVKLNNSHRGEVILELRVTANNNDDAV